MANLDDLEWERTTPLDRLEARMQVALEVAHELAQSSPGWATVQPTTSTFSQSDQTRQNERIDNAWVRAFKETDGVKVYSSWVQATRMDQ